MKIRVKISPAYTNPEISILREQYTGDAIVPFKKEYSWTPYSLPIIRSIFNKIKYLS
jgi:hypothetical protein